MSFRYDEIGNRLKAFRIASGLSADEIAHYVDTYRPLDKAGAYGVQEYIGLRGVRSIRGDYYTVMGLPVCRLVSELAAFMDIASTDGAGRTA